MSKVLPLPTVQPGMEGEPMSTDVQEAGTVCAATCSEPAMIAMATPTAVSDTDPYEPQRSGNDVLLFALGAGRSIHQRFVGHSSRARSNPRCRRPDSSLLTTVSRHSSALCASDRPTERLARRPPQCRLFCE